MTTIDTREHLILSSKRRETKNLKRICELLPGDYFAMLGVAYKVCSIQRGRLYYRSAENEKGAIIDTSAKNQMWVIDLN